MSNTFTKTERTAIHEAAHFVTYLLYYGKEVEFKPGTNILTIVSDEENLGYFAHETLSYVESDVREIKFILSGYASEFLISKKEDSFIFLGNKLRKELNVESGSDAEKSFDWVFSLYCKSNQNSDNLNLAEILHPNFIQVIEDIKNNWQLIVSVAQELLLQETIRGDQLKVLWNAILESLPT